MRSSRRRSARAGRTSGCRAAASRAAPARRTTRRSSRPRAGSARGSRRLLAAQAVLLDLAIERGPADVEDRAGPPLVPLGVGEHADDVAALELAQRRQLAVGVG